MVNTLFGRCRRENQHSILHLVVVLLLVLVANGVLLIINTFDPLLVPPYRLPSLGAMLCAGWASGVSTAVFQMVTGNRTLTPSVLGLDTLYVLLQVVLLLVLRAAGLFSLSDLGAFVLTLLVMIGVPVAPMGVVLGVRRSVITLVLLGTVLRALLRSRTTFIQRLLDPSDFLTLQGRSFASFGSISPDLLVLLLVLTAAVSILAIRELWALDVMAFGPDAATAFRVGHRRISRQMVVMVAMLVPVSTALVRPIMFLGPFVTHPAYQAAGTDHYVVTIPMAALTIMLVLVTGRTVLAQVLDADNVLSVIIEFLGGTILIALVISPRRRSWSQFVALPSPTVGVRCSPTSASAC